MHRFLITSLLSASTLAGGAALARPHQIQGVAAANVRSGSTENVVARGYELVPVAQGSDVLENPSSVITKFGYLNDFPTPFTIEPTKTEPDENTYLVLDHNPGGPTRGYDYGRRFLFQGHEGTSDTGYVTRVNLDVRDPRHRITLLTPVGADGKTHFGSIDGSTFDPFTRTLLFTQESGSQNGVIELALDWPARAHTLEGILGKGGYEGIHPDDHGNLFIVEDAGGTSVNVVKGDKTTPKAAKQPNSFIYRFVPRDPRNLQKGGALQALQVTVDGQPLVFGADPVADVFSQAQLSLHTPGSYWPVRWVTVHDTAVDGTAPFDANAAAKKAGATPFKRPENGQFQPGFAFGTFFFDTTGDTNADSGNQPELAARGAWGAIWRVDFDCSGEEGLISIVFRGDAEHNSFDNVAFADPFTLLVAEDRGDGLHKQLDALDSIWALDVFGDPAPRRLVALGRDRASTADAALGDAGTAGYQNEGDNEPTGLHVSDGSTSVWGMQGTLQSLSRTRWFFTQQHGDNTIFEIVHTR